MSTRKILIVDDEHSVRHSLQEWFREDGFAVATAEDGQDALRQMDNGPYDIVIVDLKMPGMDGITLQKRVREIDPKAAIVILTAFASVETAVESLKLGAYDYVTKPVDPDDLSHVVRNILRERELQDENARLRQEVSELALPGPIVGRSGVMQRLLELVRTVAATDSTVVIRGESGTGKELVARAIHAQSPRRFFPMVTVNCGSLAESLLESELFGHEKGAFTGAQYRRKGRIELADRGTLFLDEIGDVSAKTQIDLLRVIESKRFVRLGGNQEISSDFRLICATNRDLEALVKDGSFREDLYYRINVFSIDLPPLRDRPEDILPLARHFVDHYARAMGRRAPSLSAEVEALLENHRWPGNVRELENAIERAMVVGTEDTISPTELPLAISAVAGEPPATSLQSVERAHIARVLEEQGGNVTRSARLLGIDRATLYNKIRRYGLRE